MEALPAGLVELWTMTSIHLTLSDYVIVAGYMIVVVLVGAWFRNRVRNARDYFAGGQQIPWWMAGISHYMSSFSAFSFIAYSQLGYTYGWVAVTLFWVTIPGCLAGALYFAKHWRRARVITPIQFLEERYNGFVRQFFAWAGIPMKIFDDALKVFATGLFVSIACGVSLYWSIALCGAVMIAYSFLGGLWALVVTDYVQFLMKVLAMIFLLPMAIQRAGGIHKAFRGLPPHFFAPVNGPYGWIYVAGFAAVMVVSYNASWSLAQKYYSVPTEKDASKAAYLSAALNLVGAPLMILPAVIGRNILPDLVGQGRTADAYVLLVGSLLPAGMVGIILAAMLSATMATVSADFNAIASVLTEDVYVRFIAPSSSEGRRLLIGRWSTLLLGAVTVSLGLWVAWTHEQSLFNLMVTVLGIFLSPTLIPLLAGLTTRRVNATGAFTGFLAGLLTGFLMLSLKTWWPAADSILGSAYNFEGASLLLNTAMTLLGMILGSRFSRTPADEQQRTKAFFAAMRQSRDGIPAKASQGNPAGPALTASTLAMGALIVVAGLLSGSGLARSVDSAVGVTLILTGILLYMRANRYRHSSGLEPDPEEHRMPETKA
jgi:solute:Na+ symporter, SSS family